MSMNSRDRLIELLEEAKIKAQDTIGSMNEGFGAWYADYLHEHGIILPPCKVGDKLYLPGVGDGIRSVEVLTVTRIILDGVHDGAEFVFCTNDGDGDDYSYGRFDFVDIGQEVFFDREDAEKKLAEMSKENE